VELTLAAQHALGKRLAEKGSADLTPKFHLFSSMPTILPTHNDGVRRRYARVLEERGVDVHLGASISEVRDGVVVDASGHEHALDEVLWVTRAGAAPWVRDSGLDVDDGGFIRVGDTLESTSHPGIFAAGDISSSVNHPREKAGVFAVRQGPPLERNLRRALVGESLKPFVPQKRFLSLISTGDKYAVASRGRWSVGGAWVWRWKDWIDRRFMRKYRDLPVMAAGAAPSFPSGLATGETLKDISAIAMRCGGCGAKVGSTVLSRVLSRLTPMQGDDVIIGLDAPDDAAVTSVPPGKLLVQTIDSFRAIIDDPYVFGKIAANHSLGDIFAMNAEAKTALAVATVPFGVESKVEETLESLLRGAIEVLDEAGVSLVGGHTSEGAELSLGFAVNGVIDPEIVLRKGGMRSGDRIVITKAIGTGTLFAADMRLRAKGRWISEAITSMLQSNRAAAVCLARHGATAATDVTGFGVLGHLVEMTKASGVDASISLDILPLLDGAAETVAAGIFSSLWPQNVRLRRAIVDLERVTQLSRYPLLFDPQTAGGLLATVPAENVDACVSELRELGYGRTEIIGDVKERAERAESIEVRG
jgi:selenide,water dikinase